MINHLDNGVRIVSFIFALIFVNYMGFVFVLLGNKVFKKNEEYQSLEYNSYLEIKNSMKFHFLSYSDQINVSEDSKVSTKIILYFPLSSLIFKIYCSIILIFMQNTKIT